MINIVRVDVIYGEEMTAACIVVLFGVSLKISNEEYPCPGVSLEPSIGEPDTGLSIQSLMNSGKKLDSTSSRRAMV